MKNENVFFYSILRKHAAFPFFFFLVSVKKKTKTTIVFFFYAYITRTISMGQVFFSFLLNWYTMQLNTYLAAYK